MSPEPERLLVATDLDACLLDETTYSWEAARPALQALRSRGALLVLASSKTRAEMEPLARALEFDAPLIVENGGALVLPAGLLAEPPADAAFVGGAHVVSLGRPRAALVAALAEMARETGVAVQGFAGLDAAAVAALTGLSPAEAALALERDWGEPFSISGTGDVERLARAAERRGLSLTRGGRFLHLTGRNDKGRALRLLLERLHAAGRPMTTLALGDSPNDLQMLLVADDAVVIPRPEGAHPSLLAALPRATVAPWPGPRGWNHAVLAALARP